MRYSEPIRKGRNISYVGVNLEPGLNDTVSTITTPTYSSGVAGMNGVIMIVFAAMKDYRGFEKKFLSNNLSNSGEAKSRETHANRRAKQKVLELSGNCGETRWQESFKGIMV